MKNLPIVKKEEKDMELQHKPRLGILALMLEGYEPILRVLSKSRSRSSDL